MIIGITGASGLLGWHFRALLRAAGGHEIRLADRAVFADAARLDAFVGGVDAIAHFAGMNRGPEAEVEATNIRLAEALAAACRRTGAKPSLAFANSTHIERDTAYGRGKRIASARLRDWAEAAGAPFADLILPHVFGEFGRPFHNSVVATFCHQLAVGEAPRILVDGELELVHAQDVAARCLAALASGENGTARMAGSAMRVSELLALLTGMSNDYAGHVVPDLRSSSLQRLFNTLRSYWYPQRYPVAVELRTDPRGSLFEVVKERSGGQVFLSVTHPGVSRGNHFHTRKVERFLVMSGVAEIRVRKLFSDEVATFHVDGNRPSYVDMPTFCTHNITNVGKEELVTLFWASEIFDPADPDTFAEPVIAP